MPPTSQPRLQWQSSFAKKAHANSLTNLSHRSITLHRFHL